MNHRNSYRQALLVFMVVCFPFISYGQTFNEAQSFYNYYYDYKQANPAFLALDDQLSMTTMYKGYHFGEGITNRNFYLSAEGEIKNTKSAIGLSFMKGEFVYQKFNGVGMYYRYTIDISPNSNLTAGAQLFYQLLNVDFDRYGPIDPDDPLVIPEGSEEKENVNLDLGVVYRSPIITVGASVKNIFKQSVVSIGDSAGKESFSSFHIMATRKFTVNSFLEVSPSLYYQSDNWGDQIAVNMPMVIKELIILGAGYQYFMSGEDSNDVLSLSAGVNVKRIQFVAHVYSSLNQEYKETTGNDTYIEGMLRYRIPAEE